MAAASIWPFAARAADSDVIGAVQEELKKLDLKPVHVKKGADYQLVGDAPAAFLDRAWTLCEGLEREFLEHFEKKKFTVQRPAQPLIVVVLSGPLAYAKFLGVTQEEVIGGHYDLDTNRLVIFDNRSRADAGLFVERANTVALMHEGAHQLCYNTGLLDFQSDVPTLINEGLAVYCETRRPDGHGRIGQVNTERLRELEAAHRDGRHEQTFEQLLVQDGFFDDEETQQVAYSQAWEFLYFLMRSPERAAQLRTYLATLRKRKDTSHRVEDARAAFGDLDRLDREVRHKTGRPVRR